MSQNPGAPALPAEVPTFESFARIAETDLYAPLPDDWIVGTADIVDSTLAIEAGRYKTVNMAGAAVIAAVSNAVGQRDYPFVFGGDGASFAVPPPWAEAARGALAATATFVEEEFGLSLRVAAVPVAAIREAGLDLRVARFAASPHVSYAMFSGGGLAWAEEQLKAGRFAVPKAPAGSRPNLDGLTCRFDAVPSRRGVILSLIVRPRPAGDPERYRATIARVLALVGRARDEGRPLPAQGPRFGAPTRWVGSEARIAAPPGRGRWATRIGLVLRGILAYVSLTFRIPVGRFDPARYMADLVANSDYRKYDDGLRMTIDCAPEVADAIEAFLAEAAGQGDALYGLHRQDAALVTCITPSPFERDHIHFIDGAAGGYAQAALRLKASMS
ncbi:DUF3095 domain-containing protein [Enterovirga rhinocerotis]|uniref:DUF3095 family protein n=1 Tax=Enterovirga rhinocerotis TaxID=1339210 RepID=A0A4R7C606_9HYPH|nr:DUF3095 domain-containing protein [Enterovirga rhinocerotis]TDR93661.1 DUF3095 family protein [Enterovirga rhinocerotis]